MNNKVVIMRAVDTIQKLSSAYQLKTVNYLQDVMDTDQVKLPSGVENLLALANQTILELHELLNENQPEEVCKLCLGKGFIPDHTYPRNGWAYMDCPECKNYYAKENN